MSSQKLLGLPPTPPELKPILPFLQRAEELKTQDPTIAYWCAYYAAQVGISLKARDSASRDVLFNLLGVLEKMKAQIGSVDTIEIEAASAAYVENFALKVFNSADSEDRKGAATRATAKKFLAASTFLEVLKTFPKTEVSDSTDEKARYAKWKAADIARAFREGRKPTPGPAGQEQDPQPAERSPPSIRRTTPPPRLDQTDFVRANIQADLRPGEGEVTPGSWSTTATPGTAHDSISLPPTSTLAHNISYGTSPKGAQKGHGRSGSGSSTNSGSGSGSAPSKSRKAWTSEELEGKITPSSSPPRPSAMKASGSNGSPDGKKTVHFSPVIDAPSSPPFLPPLPPKAPSPTEAYQGPPSIYAPGKSTPSPPSIPHTSISTGSYPVLPPSPPSSSSPPRSSNIYAPPPPQQPAYGARVPPSQSVDLTPSVIAKAQKHCRFAISALDYEDAEQAKKELRTALSILGGL